MTKRAFAIPYRIKYLAPVLATAFALAPGPAEAQNSPTLPESGVWFDDTGNGAVEIYVCQEKANRLCGRIVWLKEPLNAEGRPKRDRYNPNPDLQTRPICGLPVLGNLARDSDGGFDGGWIYDPKAGKSYSAAIRLAQRDRLVVTGYLGLKFMGKSFTWTRAPADLERCDVASAAELIQDRAPAPGARTTTPSSPKPQSTPNAKAATTAPGAKTVKKTTTSSKHSKEPAASTATAVPKPKPAQRPVRPATSTAPAAQPPGQTSGRAPDPLPPDTAMSWSD